MKREWLCYTLVAVGFLQTVGHVTKVDWLKGIGAVTVASPLPIVFTEVNGVETFAQDFYLKYEDAHARQVTIKITPELYSQLQAPYNYRNVLGAAVSYGPILPEALWRSVLRFAFLEPGELSQTLGVESPMKNAAIYIKTRTAGRHDEWTLTLEKPE